MTLIKFDDRRQAIFAEWPEGQQCGQSRLLTWPRADIPDTARTVSAHTLDPQRFYQVGYGEPYDGGQVGGDIQAGTAWKRRWATWHNDGDGLVWRVTDVTAYLADDEGSLHVACVWDFVAAATLHDVYGAADEDGYTEVVMKEHFYPTDDRVRAWIGSMPDMTVTERALDWWHE